MQLPAAKKAIFGAATTLALCLVSEGFAQLWVLRGRPGSGGMVAFATPGTGEMLLAARDPRLGWRFHPGAPLGTGGECANSRGERGPDLEPESRPTKRIVCLGSSATFGFGVQWEGCYAGFLRRWVRNSAPDSWDVINAGVPGYSAAQMLALLRARGKLWHPSVVLIFPSFWDNFTPALELNDAETLELEFRGSDWRRIARKSALYSFIRSRLPHATDDEGRARARELGLLWLKEVQRPNGPRASATQFQRTLRQLCQESKELGAKVVLVSPPARTAIIDNYSDSPAYHQILVKLGEELGIPVVFAREEFLTDAEDTEDSLYLDTLHLTQHAHALLARSISWQLLQLGLSGLPDHAIEAKPLHQISLKARQPFARHFIGIPPEEISGEDAAKLHEKSINMPAYHSIQFAKLRIPKAALLDFTPGFYTRHDFTESARAPVASPKNVGPVGFGVSVRAEGQPPKLLYREERSANDELQWVWYGRRLVDLSAYKDSEVTLELTGWGPVSAVTWGEVKIISHEP
jgi:lysophospholipase L1-like esterase